MQKTARHTAHTRYPKNFQKIHFGMANVVHTHNRLFSRRLESRKGR